MPQNTLCIEMPPQISQTSSPKPAPLPTNSPPPRWVLHHPQGINTCEICGLVERGADLTVRAKLPGHYERPGEIVECAALGYALLFGGASRRRTVSLLRERGAVE
jgi:hypothetical protein